jgi:hypothetical protein
MKNLQLKFINNKAANKEHLFYFQKRFALFLLNLSLLLFDE